MNQTKQQKILILRLSSIGDIVLSTAFIRQTRMKFPDACIDFVIKKKFSELVRYNPHLNHIYYIEASTRLLKLRNHIKKKKYDYIFDLHNNFRTNILTRGLSSVDIGRISKDKWKRFILVKAKKNRYKNVINIPERYLNTGKKAGIVDDFNGLEIFWKDYFEDKVNRYLKASGIKDKFYIIAPGAGFYTKRWPIEYIKELTNSILNQTDKMIVIMGGNSDSEMAEQLAIDDRIINTCGKLSILESAITVSKAEAVVANDSGVMHLATAVKTPVIAIFGSTVRQFGFWPFRSENYVMEDNSVKCRPCSHLGYNKCPKKHFNCMRNITPTQVFSQLEKIRQTSNEFIF